MVVLSPRARPRPGRLCGPRPLRWRLPAGVRRACRRLSRLESAAGRGGWDDCERGGNGSDDECVPLVVCVRVWIPHTRTDCVQTLDPHFTCSLKSSSPAIHCPRNIISLYHHPCRKCLRDAAKIRRWPLVQSVFPRSSRQAVPSVSGPRQ